MSWNSQVEHKTRYNAVRLLDKQFNENLTKNPKIIGLLPVRNIGFATHFILNQMSQTVDSIVILDDYSTDNTVDLIKLYASEFNVEALVI